MYEFTDPNYTLFTAYDYELYKNVPLIIWSKDLDEGKVIDTPMGMIDVLPTIGNMLNIYNKYALGNDIMSIKDKENIVIFNIFLSINLDEQTLLELKELFPNISFILSK